MTRTSTFSPCLSLSILAACALGGASLGCSSSDEDDAPEVVVLEPWGRSFGDAGTSVQITAVSAGASGNVALAGTFTGSVDLGAGELKSTATPNMLLAKLDTEGQHIWSGRTGGGDDIASGIALDRGGAALVAGTFNGFVDFGTAGELSGASDVFLARFGAQGDPLWSRAIGSGSGGDSVNDIHVDRMGGTYLLGNASGDIDFGLGPILPGQWAQIYLAKLNNASGAVYSVGFTSNDYCTARRFAVDADGNAVIFGDFYGTVNLGGGPITANNGAGLFIVKLDPNGHHVWSKGITAKYTPEGFGGASSNSVAVTPGGEVIVTGNYSGVLDFVTDTIDAGQDYNAMFMLQYGADGSFRWAKSFVGDSSSYKQITGVAADANGDVHLAGVFSGSVDFGGGPLSAANQSIFVARFDAAGKLLMSQRFGGDGFQSLSAFTVTTGGNAIVAGSFSQTLDLGSTKLTAPDGASQAFIAALPH